MACKEIDKSIARNLNKILINQRFKKTL